MQYTIRGIPNAVDKAMRNRARVARRSLNEVAVEVLAEGLGLGKDSVPRRDLSDVTGTWSRDAAAEEAFAAQDQVDESLWK
ncbi:MAG TPA: hypothetical protein VHL58_06885 [Thermoanaerobaculia bacterium]|nr:hypothetical protein [Thermoanaerobaculia bacterium]